MDSFSVMGLILFVRMKIGFVNMHYILAIEGQSVNEKILIVQKNLTSPGM